MDQHRVPDAEAMDVSIASLPLSNRTRSRLLNAGITTVGMLDVMADDELLRFRGFGHTCLQEVRGVVRAIKNADDSQSLPPAQSIFPRGLSDVLQETRLSDLPIPNRAQSVFQREGIETVGDYIARGEERLLKLQNFGETTLEAVNRSINTSVVMQQGGAETSFRSKEVMNDDLSDDPVLARVSINALDLPRRARRACQEMGLRTLHDLSQISSTDLLVRKNFGQATLRRIQSEVDRYLSDQRLREDQSFREVLDSLLSRLQSKERSLVEMREGRFQHDPMTLTEAGRAMGITESRACQIEHAAWGKLRRFSAGVTDMSAERAISFLIDQGGIATPETLMSEEYFQDSNMRAAFLSRMLAKLLPHRLARLADGRLVAVPAATLYTLAARLRNCLSRRNESYVLSELTGKATRDLDLQTNGLGLVKALCEVIHHREVSSDPSGRMVVRTPSQGLGDDLSQILVDEGGPLHFSMIAKRIGLPPYSRDDLSQEKVRLRLCRDDRFLLVKRGYYDLRERFHIEPALRDQLIEASLVFLRSSGRPTSVSLISSHIQENECFENVSECVLSQVMREDSRITHLGRGSFVPAGDSEKSVKHVSEMLASILENAPGPVSYAELKKKVKEQRQVSDGAISATLVGRDAFLRVERGMFDLSSRYPFDEGQRTEIAQRSGRQIDRHGGVISLSVMAELMEWDEGTDRPNPILLGDLLRRKGGFRFPGGGYVCRNNGQLEKTVHDRATELLKNESEPLRPSTIGRRLGLGKGGVSLLRQLLRESSSFVGHPDGRYHIASQ